MENMKQIERITLFVSVYSDASEKGYRDIISRGLEVTRVFLDSQKDRIRVLNGKRLKITSVPTAVVKYDDNTIQVLKGRNHISKWLSSIVQDDEHDLPEENLEDLENVNVNKDVLIEQKPDAESERDEFKNQVNMMQKERDRMINEHDYDMKTT